MVSNIKNFFKILALGVGIILAYMILSWNEYLSDIELWPGVESPRVLVENINEQSKDYAFNIFFVETNENKTKLTSKESCAIESAALNNPNALVFYYSKNVVIDKDLVVRYKNIRAKKLIVDAILDHTSIYVQWLRMKSRVKLSNHNLNHISNALRLAFMWKYGGIYLDTDIITIKDLSFLLNFPGIGAYTESGINNAVLVFPKNHPFINQTMVQFFNDYNPKCFSCYGPQLITRVFKDFCKTKYLYQTHLLTKKKIYDKLTDSRGGGIKNDSQCNNIFIYPINYFYSIAWQKYNLIFSNDSKVDKEIFIDSFGVHFWNKMSKNNHSKPGDGSIYDYFSKSNCPSIKTN